MKKLIEDFLAVLKNEKKYSDNTIINYNNYILLFYYFLKEQNIDNIKEVDYQTIRKHLNYLY